MAKDNKDNKNQNGDAQNIEGVLAQLRRSYSDEAENTDDFIDIKSESDNVSHDELQAMLRSQFLSDDLQEPEENEDEYFIDEDFLSDASQVDDDYNGDDTDIDYIEKIEKEEEFDYGYYEKYG